MLIPFVCNAQKARRVSAGVEAGPSSTASGRAYRLEEILSDNVQGYNPNKAYSLNEEVEEDNYQNEISVAVGATIPCTPFASYILDNIVQGAKNGFAVNVGYTVWFMKNIGFGIDIKDEYFGYDFSKVPPYNPYEWQTDVKISKTGWNLVALGVSLRTKFPVYKNAIFLTGNVSMKYGMLNSPVEKVSYKEDDVMKSEVVFPRFMSYELLIGGSIGVRARLKRRLYGVINLDYNYATSNNKETIRIPNVRTGLFSDYSAFSVEAGIAYAF
jgi:hypothetical protein